MELKLIEERPASLLVQAEGMEFEIDPRDTTRDRDLAEALLARSKERTPDLHVTIAERWRIDDRKFLAEESFRWSAAEEAHLRNAVDQPKSR